jgi:hypothetical protein
MEVTQPEAQISLEECNTVEANLYSSNFNATVYIACVGPQV